MFIIYTRTSSITSFKKDSPSRQEEIISAKFTQLSKNKMIINEQCNANVPLKDRVGFQKIIEIAKTQKVIQYLESFSRLGRSETILNEFLELNKTLNIKVKLAMGTTDIFNPSPIYDPVRKYALDLVANEVKFLRTSQLKAKERALSKGEKFDGRKNLLEIHPNLADLKKTESIKNMSLKAIGTYLYTKYNIKTSKNNPLSKSAVQSIFNRLNIRRFSTFNSNKWASININLIRSFANKSNSNKEDSGSIVNKIISKLTDNIIFNADDNNYYLWNGKYWEFIQLNSLLNYLYKEIVNQLQNSKVKVKYSDDHLLKKIKLIVNNLKITKLISKFDNHNFLNFNNGVYNIKTKKFLPHDKKYLLNSIINIDFNPDLDLTKFKETNIYKWLQFITYNNPDLIFFILCYIHCIIFSKIHFQIYIELIGKGGTGKTTFVNLISALIGRNNIVITDLNKLESNKFETANLKDKKLILINDSSQYSGKVSVLKNIIGLDFLRYEEKMKQPGNPFIISGLVIISSNELLQLGDLTSGLSRRRVVLFFNRKPNNSNNLISFINNQYTGLFVNELPLLFFYCLNINNEDINRIMSQPLELPLLKEYFTTNQQLTNHIVDFIFQFLYFLPSSNNLDLINLAPNSLLPLSKEASFEGYKDFNIYSAYLLYCKKNHCKPLGLSRFTMIFLDNLSYIYSKHSIEYHKNLNGYFISQFAIKDFHNISINLPSPTYITYTNSNFLSTDSDLIKFSLRQPSS